MPRNEFHVVSPTDPAPRWPDGYVAALCEAVAQEKTIPYCIGWVRRFFARFTGRHRRDLGRAEIEAFLSEIAALPRIGNWQVQQARDALELYYVKFRGIALEPRESVPAHPHERSPARFPPLAGDAPHTVSGTTVDGVSNMRSEYSKPSASVKLEKSGKSLNAECSVPGAQGVGEAGTSGGGRCDWKVLEERMRDVLRTEHYAYATEQSYVAWMRRYVAFHGWRKPSTLEAEHVHAFLKQLVKKYLSLYCDPPDKLNAPLRLTGGARLVC